MKNKIISKGLVFGIIVLFFGAGMTTAINSNLLQENTGIHLQTNSTPSGHEKSKFQDDVLLIPDWTYDRVLAFDPYDGSYIGEIIPDDGRLSSPKSAIPSTRGTIFVSDQLEDAVFEYDTDGNYITTIVNQASSGIDNIRGITVNNGYLYVTVYQGTYADTIQRFDLNGGSQMTWTSTQIDSPFDIHFRSNDALVTNADSDAIDQYNHNGNWLGTFVGTGIEFPSQIYERSNGNLYVTGSFSPAGIYEYDQNGVQLNYYPIALTMRGVYELGNGLILFTSSLSVSTYNPANGQIVDIYTDGNFNFIHLMSAVTNQPPYEPRYPDPADDAIDVPLNAVLSWTGGDPDPDDTVTYDVYFGTVTPPPKVASNESATTYNPGIMNPITKYYWQIDAWDNHGASTSGPAWEFTTKINNPPNTPDIDGPEKGKVGTSIDFNFNAIDPDNDDVNFYIEWGDGSIEDWIGPYDSGETVKVSHIWTEKGTYIIKAKAKDVYDAESDYAELEISIPRNKAFFTIQPIFTRLFERFPNIFPILRYLLGL